MTTLFLMLALAQQPAAEPRLIGPSEAAKLAAADVQTLLSEHEQHGALYAYFPEADPVKAAGFSYAVNTALNRTGLLAPVAIVAGGHLARVDLFAMAEGKDLANLLDLLENRLAFADPFFHKRGLVRKGGNYFLKEPIPPYVANDGKTYDYKTVPIRREEQFALHLAEHGMENILLLHGLTGRDLPIVRADWFQNVILSTINVGLTKGLYYEFRGVKGQTLPQILAGFGVKQETIDKLDSDSFAAILASKVTDRGRRIVAFYGSQVKPTQGLPLILITFDTALGDVREDQDPILNILDSKVTAKEIFIFLPNGLILFLLTNGQDVLQDFAPDQVAHDRTVESPSPKTLVPAVSCIACHTEWKHLAADGTSTSAKMFIEFENDILAMYQQQFGRTKRGAIIDEFGGRKGSISNLFKAYSKYSGDLKPILRLASVFHSDVTFTLTGHKIEDVGTSIQQVRDDYCYTHRTRQRLLYDLGERVEPVGKTPLEKSRYMAKRFAEIVPPFTPNSDGISEEDGRLLPFRNELRELTITPAQEEAVFADAALRRWNAKKEAGKK